MRTETMNLADFAREHPAVTKVAIHEAGHHVAMRKLTVLGANVMITLEPGEDYTGFVQPLRMRHVLARQGEIEMITDCAGAIAESMWTGQRVEPGDKDLQNCQSAARSALGLRAPQEDIDREVRRAMLRASRLIADCWLDVMAEAMLQLRKHFGTVEAIRPLTEDQIQTYLQLEL